MAKPKLLIMDEPSMGLAPLMVKNIFNIIEMVNKEGVTVLLVEQNANMALQSQRACIRNRKNCIAGTAKELQESEEVKAAYLGGL